MENKIDISKLLKDCPKGMELDCSICNGVKFIELDRSPNFPIVVRANNGYEFSLTKYGQVHNIADAKCVIFPKGKTTWEGFQRPFKDGDVIYTYNFIAILSHIAESGAVWYHCYYCISTKNFNAKHYCGIGNINNDEFRLATEEEKQKLFNVIKDNGYEWNPETKTLEKLVVPKFKVGDRVRLKLKPNYVYTIHSLAWDDNKKLAYRLLPNNDKHLILVSLNAQDDYESAPNKFDITTLKPFKSRVLVRSDKSAIWKPAIYGIYKDSLYWMVGGSAWIQCIPYSGNEHLFGTTNDCDEFYKNWK